MRIKDLEKRILNDYDYFLRNKVLMSPFEINIIEELNKLKKENQDLLVLNETLKDMNEQSQNKIKELEEEKEKLISDLVKMQNELNFVKCQNDLLRIEIYNCQGGLL